MCLAGRIGQFQTASACAALFGFGGCREFWEA
jgi:hypothetical protein